MPVRGLQCSFQANELLYTGPSLNGLITWSEDNIIAVGCTNYIYFLNARHVGQRRTICEVEPLQNLLPANVKCPQPSCAHVVTTVLSTNTLALMQRYVSSPSDFPIARPAQTQPQNRDGACVQVRHRQECPGSELVAVGHLGG